MNERDIRALLAGVRAGEVDIDDAVGRLAALPYKDLGFANVDTHRALRQGFPEVIFGQGKTLAQITAIMETLRAQGGNILVTRIAPETGDAIAAAFEGAVHDPVSRTLVLRQQPFEDRGRGTVLILAAGTTDMPVAEEAAITAELVGNRVERLYDVGVAGLHRLLARIDRIRAASVIVAVAGMEGALASVVGGLVAVPVIAVPTSVGYGAHFQGLAPLLTMINSCASTVALVNIDNGFGAGYVASLINRKRPGDAA